MEQRLRRNQCIKASSPRKLFSTVNNCDVNSVDVDVLRLLLASISLSTQNALMVLYNTHTHTHHTFGRKLNAIPFAASWSHMPQPLNVNYGSNIKSSLCQVHQRLVHFQLTLGKRGEEEKREKTPHGCVALSR